MGNKKTYVYEYKSPNLYTDANNVKIASLECTHHLTDEERRMFNKTISQQIKDKILRLFGKLVFWQ